MDNRRNDLRERFDVIIAGGGMGGLNLAALLSVEGKRVLVLEAGGPEQLGGRAASGKISDATVDNRIKGLIMAGSEDGASSTSSAIWDGCSVGRWPCRTTRRPWCASSLALPGDDTEYQVSFWLQMGWWDKPNHFQRHEASHKAALEAEVMGVYGSAQTALAAADRILGADGGGL